MNLVQKLKVFIPDSDVFSFDWLGGMSPIRFTCKPTISDLNEPINDMKLKMTTNYYSNEPLTLRHQFFANDGQLVDVSF